MTSVNLKIGRCSACWSLWRKNCGQAAVDVQSCAPLQGQVFQRFYYANTLIKMERVQQALLTETGQDVVYVLRDSDSFWGLTNLILCGIFLWLLQLTFICNSVKRISMLCTYGIWWWLFCSLARILGECSTIPRLRFYFFYIFSSSFGNRH